MRIYYVILVENIPTVNNNLQLIVRNLLSSERRGESYDRTNDCRCSKNLQKESQR